MTVQIITGDCREVLKTLPDESVHCVVTSPPYWGLRDYGTAQWDGGDPSCDHSESSPSRRSASVASSKLDGGKNSVHLSHQFKGDCLRCGAIRIDRQIGLEANYTDFIGFDQVGGFIAQHAAAMRAGWLETFDHRGRVFLGPCCSGKRIDSNP